MWKNTLRSSDNSWRKGIVLVCTLTAIHVSTDLIRISFRVKLTATKGYSRCDRCRPNVLRPPRGRFHVLNLVWAFRMGIRVVHYTVTSNDWKAQSAAAILQTVAVRDLVEVKSYLSMTQSVYSRGTFYHPS